MCYKKVLNEVRLNPESAFAKMGFITNVEKEGYDQGGKRSVEIICRDEREQIYEWSVENKPGDIYYFPYKNRRLNAQGQNCKGIGHVIVPKGEPDGTIVLSGGMNGCGLQVNKFDAGNLIFMHDQDSEAISDEMSRQYFIDENRFGRYLGADDLIDPPKILCRVKKKHYLGPGDLHLKDNFRRAEEKFPGKDTYLTYYPFFIKVQGIWKLYMSLTGKVCDEKGDIFRYIKGEGVYLPNIYCVTSFEE